MRHLKECISKKPFFAAISAVFPPNEGRISMRCLLLVLVLQGVVSLQLGIVHLRQPAPSRAHVVLSEVLLATTPLPS